MSSSQVRGNIPLHCHVHTLWIYVCVQTGGGSSGDIGVKGLYRLCIMDPQLEYNLTQAEAT